VFKIYLGWIVGCTGVPLSLCMHFFNHFVSCVSPLLASVDEWYCHLSEVITYIICFQVLLEILIRNTKVLVDFFDII